MSLIDICGLQISPEKLAEVLAKQGYKIEIKENEQYYTEPEEHTNYYYIDDMIYVRKLQWTGSSNDLNLFKVKNVFKDSDECHEYINHFIARRTIKLLIEHLEKKYADDYVDKYSLAWDNDRQELYPLLIDVFNTDITSSYKVISKVIEMIPEEVKYYLGVENDRNV